MKNANQARESGTQQMMTIDPDLITAMQCALPSGKPDRVMQAYGISWNTWTKLRDHQPIRHSLTQRLLARIGHDGTRIPQCLTRIAAANGEQ